MTLVFDTSVLIDIQRNHTPTIAVMRELRKMHPLPAQITVISYFEFLYGLHEKNPRNKGKAFSFVNNFGVLQTTKTTAAILADLKHIYDKKGLMISLADLLTASLVLENNMTLLTKDKDFENIKELETVVI